MNLNEIKEKIIEASKYYYNTEELLMSDEEFDNLKDMYLKLGGDEKEIIGSLPINKNTLSVSHSYTNLAGTLHKTNNIEEMKEFIKNQVEKIISTVQSNKELSDIIDIEYTLKYDGNSVIIEYKDGKAISAMTRGKDGVGLNLMDVFGDRTISKLDECAVKYEAIVSYKNFNKLLELDDSFTYKNPRSLISGLLGKTNAKYFKKYITLIPLEVRYKNKDSAIDAINDKDDLYIDEMTKSDPEYLEGIISFNIERMAGCRLFNTSSSKTFNIDKTLKEFEDYYNYVYEHRSELPFMIDGIVVMVRTDWNVVDKNYSNNIPNFGLAIKFPYMEKKTTVTNISYSLGSAGSRITPMCHFEPIEFNGTTHDKQSLQNYKRFQELRLGIGSEILVSYVNDVLCYIQPIVNEHNSQIVPEIFTNTCPVCGGDVGIQINDSEVATLAFCINPECKGKIVGKVNNFITKIKLKGLNINTIEKLFVNGLLDEDINDLFTLDREDVINIDGLGENAWKLIKEIQDKVYYDYEIIGSLNIDNFSIRSAKEFCKVLNLQDIISEFRTQSKLGISGQDVTESNKKFKEDFINEVIKIEGFSEITAEYIYDGIWQNLTLIDDLVYLNGGCKFIKDEIKTTGEVLTVVMSGVRDSEISDYVEKNGGKISGSVSKKANILVVKDKSSTSSKTKKALELGITIMNVEEFKEKYLK